jgi:hypothetical protein
LRIEEWQIDLDKKKFGPKFKKDGKAVEAAIEALTQDVREKLSLELKENGKITVDVPGVGKGKVDVDEDLVTIQKRTRVESMREYTPNVIVSLRRSTTCSHDPNTSRNRRSALAASCTRCANTCTGHAPGTMQGASCRSRH